MWCDNQHSEDKGDQMKRLTYPGDYCQDIARCENNCSGSCQAKRQWERLRAYEETGLSPEEVEDLKHGNSEKLP